MKKLIVAAMAIGVITGGCAGTENENPLLGEFNTPYGTPPFNQIKLEHYMPAFEEGIRQSKAEVEAIANNSDEPTFENTIEALERQGELLTRVATVFFALNAAETSDEMDNIANKFMPMLTELQNSISLNPQLFERVKTVHDYYYGQQWDEDPLGSPEKWMLLKETYNSFVRNGAGLNEEDKQRYREITTELSTLSLKFGQNVLAETNAFTLNIPVADSAKVEGLPSFVRDGMAAEAKERGEEGWTVTLQVPSYLPFMTYSTDRELKEKLWRVRGALCNNDGATGNKANVKRISELRLRLANLLGYNTYADYELEERMAGSTATVDGFLDELLVKTYGWAKDDYNQVAGYAKTSPGGGYDMMPWDYSYWSEKYKNAHYDLNEEEVKPYFRLENAQKGVFMLAEKLFGITFRKNPQIQVYHKDVKAYEVLDKDGSLLSVLYMDYFPRASKRGGAWMTTFREMYTTADGTEVRPLVTLNFNFTKPAGDTPSLLTFDELETLLHEFGHGLHGMFAEGNYASLTGTNVYRDFVELPSQLMENWATEKEFLDLWAEHYQTGEKIPAELVAKIDAAKNYQAAYGNVRQLSYSISDMAWHTITSPVTMEPEAFEKASVKRTEITPPVAGSCMSTAFSHIFAGGYAAGYYSYKWAEVLEADAYSLFEEKGIFDRATAESYRENILSKGGSENPMTLYVRFRGHEPQTSALVNKIKGDRK